MSTLFYGTGPVQRDEEIIRSTTEPAGVDNDAPAAEAPAPPDWNELETDKSERGGLSTNQLASHVEPSTQYRPDPLSNANTDFASPINNQVSSSGTAAQRESGGRWGHGTMQIAEGIEPQIVDGHEFREEYFTAWKTMPQGMSSNYMRPSFVDPATEAHMAALGRKRAASANSASMYAAWYEQSTGLGGS